MYRAIYEDYLAHHGILGQKWGVRRYQPYPKNYNGDGKYKGKQTKKKVKRIAKGAGKAAAVGGVVGAGAVGIKKSFETDAFKPGPKGKPSAAEHATRSTSEMFDTSRRILDRRESESNKRDFSAEAEKKSSEQLAKEIKRLRLENEYIEVSNMRYKSRDKTKARAILDIAGDIASVAVPVAGVAASIYKIKRG